MNFKITKRLFANALSIVSKAVSSGAVIPQLSGILIEVEPDRIIFTGSNSDISIRKTVKACDDCQIIEHGKVCIESRYLNEIVRKIDSDLVSVELIDGSLTKISGIKAEFNINGMRASDYPAIDFSYNEDINSIDGEIFNDLVSQTAFACSEKETRPALCGVNFKTNGKELVATATDSYHLAQKKINVEFDSVMNITIPSKILNEVVSILGDEDLIKFSLSKNRIAFVTDDSIILASLIEDAYPDTSKLLVEGYSSILEINSKELFDAVERSSFIKSDGRNVVKLSLSEEEVEISSKAQEIGSSKEKLSLATYHGQPLSISCSGKYLSDAIKALRSEVISLEFTGEFRPIILRSKDDKTITQLISPVRSY